MKSLYSFSIIALLLVHIDAFSQKEIPMFTASSKKSTRPVAMVAKTTAIEHKASKAVPHYTYYTEDDGVLIMAGDEVYKYKSDYTLAFKADITDMLKFPQLSTTTSVVSDENATYILEVKNNSKEKVSVISIDQKGAARQQSYELDINKNKEYTPFIVNGKLCILGKSVDSKEDKVVYKYYHIENDKLTSKSIALPVDDYEYDQIRKEDGSSTDYYWQYLQTNGNNAVLVKAYFKKIEKSKKYSFVCQLIEVDQEGVMSGKKDIKFEPKLAGDDREFFAPRIIFNMDDQSIFFTGYMEIDKSKINGLYLLKYDYKSGSLIYNKEYQFNDLMKPDIKKNAKVHYAIPESVSSYYPVKIRREDVLIDNINKVFNVRMITNFGFNSTTFFEVAFNNNGEHIKTGVTEYDTFINYYRNYLMNPTGHQDVWSDKSQTTNLKADPWKFINSQATDEKSKVYWVPVSTLKGNSVIKWDGETKKFSAVQLN